MGFLNKILGNKEDKSTETESKKRIILSMPMFKGDKAYSLNEIVQDLESYWGLDAQDVEGDDNTAMFKVDGESVAVALMPAPIPSAEFEDMYGYSYLWKDAEAEIKEHRQHAIVSILSGDSKPLKKYSLLTKINASVLRTCENAIGVYQGASTLLLPKELYVDFANFLLEDILPIQLWIYIGIIDNGNTSSVYTYGLKEFGKEEMEIINSDMESCMVYDFLISILDYVLSRDVILKHGETIGFTAEQKIKIIESEAVYLDGKSLKLEV